MATILQRVDALAEATDLVAGRIPQDVELKARAVVEQANRRLAAGPQTVVALAGATGSGKSSLFNALSGTRLAEQGPRRPTTTTTLAVSFAATNNDLLTLLGITYRREAEPPLPGMTDLVLLDLPDHDSRVRAHRDEVDQLVGVVDQFVWVLDPQKYADAAVHQRYLRPLAKHQDVICVVLNQADRLGGRQLSECLSHLRQLLTDDGLPGVPIIATSTLTGQGISDLRGRLVLLAEGKRAAAQRLAADVTVTAAALQQALGQGRTVGASRETLNRVHDQLAAAAGVPIVVEAVRDATRHRGRLATGWPLVSWVGRLRPDPLRRLRLGGRRPDDEVPEVHRSSLPARSAAAQAQLASGLRALTAELGHGMPPPWRDAVAQAVRQGSHGLADRLDRAVVATDLDLDDEPVWWRMVRALQWLLIAAVVAGLAWLGVAALAAYLGLPAVGMVPVGRLPLPVLLLAGGLIGGIVVHALSGAAINSAARRAANRARRELHGSIAAVAQEALVNPAEAEVERYAAARAALDRLS